jgi:hypothetical protein
MYPSEQGWDSLGSDAGCILENVRVGVLRLGQGVRLGGGTGVLLQWGRVSARRRRMEGEAGRSDIPARKLVISGQDLR